MKQPPLYVPLRACTYSSCKSSALGGWHSSVDLKLKILNYRYVKTKNGNCAMYASLSITRAATNGVRYPYAGDSGRVLLAGVVVLRRRELLPPGTKRRLTLTGGTGTYSLLFLFSRKLRHILISRWLERANE